MLLTLLLAVGLVAAASSHYIYPAQHGNRPNGLSDTCGYESCTDAEPGLLNVHIVAHTHDDVGWLKTVDEYYYGSKSNIQKAGVQYILDSVIKELWEDPKRKFIYVETAFFWKWWRLQTRATQSKVHTLVNQGRLQFVGGAWSMNDEAASHYQSTIDQFTWGLHKLNETFGTCAIPRVGWQIDPFGHAREFANLLAGMGYDGLFLGRIDYQDKTVRKDKKTMEMLWRGDDDLGKPSDIFTGVLYNTYSPPPGFCFDVLCSDEPIIDDPNSPIYNVDQRISEFLTYVQEESKHYRSNNVAVTMGGDFTYQDAGMWYRNLDKLVQHANLKAAKDGLNIKLFYSTPTCYLKAVKESNVTLPTKQDDFFPYASDPHAYWTGYFTSRPTTKYFERQGNSYLQMVKQLQVLADLEEHNMFVLNELKSAMGVMQHHDAITGTEKQAVTHDYERMMTSAIDDALVIAGQAFNKIMQRDAVKAPVFAFNRCRLNESSCHISETSEQFVVTVYNHLAWHVNDSVRVPVKDGDYEVYAPNGDKITSQLVDIPTAVKSIPTRTSEATHEIVFIAYLKPVSFKSYYIKTVPTTTTKTRRDVNSKDKLTVEKEPQKDMELLKASLDDALAKFWESQMSKDESRGEVNMQRDKGVTNKAEKKWDSDLVHLEQIIKEANDEVLRYRRLQNSRSISSNLVMADDPMIVERSSDDYLENQHMKLRIDTSTGAMTHVIMSDGSPIDFNVQYYYYPGAYGNNEVFENRSSGAYIFRPTSDAIPLTYQHSTGPVGPVVQEYRTEYRENVASYIRLYDGLNFIESEWVVGPIDISDGVGKEFIVKYTTDISSNEEFYTDSNGRQMIKRTRDKRPQFNDSLTEPIASNYYPVVNKIAIQDTINRMAVITDRSEGGSSLNTGEIELMLHRRLLHDDSFGVGEALNETAKGVGLVVRGKQRIYFSKKGDKQGYVDEKKLALQFHTEPQVFVSDSEHVSLDDWLKLNNMPSFVNKLPNGVHLLTVEPWADKKLLFRLENYLELSDLENTNIELDLDNIFKDIKVNGFRETTLSANQWLDEHKKWTWDTEDVFSGSFNSKDAGKHTNTKVHTNIQDSSTEVGLKIVLKSREIRTFVVDYEFK